MIRTVFRLALGKRGFGYLPSPEDSRDVLRLSLSAGYPNMSMALDRLVHIRSQGATSSCTAHAVDAALQILAKNYTLRSVAEPYYYARSLDGGRPADTGAYLRNALKAISRLGVCPETDWPLRVASINRQPSATALHAGFSWRGLRYSRLPGAGVFDSIKAALSAGHPVVFGTDVDEAFCANDGPQTIDTRRGPSVGGHAMTLTGYDGDLFRLANSWGADWRDGGRAWVSRGFILGVREFWAVEGWPA